MIKLIQKTLSSPYLMPLFFSGISALALSMALLSQYVGGLHPCILCLYQRIPYAFIIFIGIITTFYRAYGESLGGEFVDQTTHNKITSGFLSTIGIAFFINSALAFYHTGVEQHWWKSIFQSCSVPELKGDMEQILFDIQNRAHAARCDEIPWSDPILNLSMANYNILFCLGFGIIAFISARLIWKKSS